MAQGAITNYDQYLPKIHNPRKAQIMDCPDYYIYEDGRVWSNKSNKFMALRWRYGITGGKYDVPSNGDYLTVGVKQNGKHKVYYIHRLLAIYFIPNPDPENFNEVDHINGLKWDNRLENLAWCNRSKNIKTHYKRDDNYFQKFKLVHKRGVIEAAKSHYKPIKRIDKITKEEIIYQSLDRVRDDGINPWHASRMANHKYVWEWIKQGE